MYGLEKKGILNELYDLEKDCRVPQKAAHWRKKIDEHAEEIKNSIRLGASSQEFQELETVLQAYMALKKVINRIAR